MNKSCQLLTSLLIFSGERQMGITSAVITGGASGIGAALAKKFAFAGAQVVVADINVERAEATASEICADGGNAIAIHVDHADEASIEKLSATCFAHLGQIDAVFANAGVGAGGPIHTTPQHNIDWILRVNLMGPLWMARHFASKMAEQKTPSRFIITGSEHSLGLPSRGGQASIYTLSKHAVLGLAETLRRDLANTNVAVSIICPAVVNTEIVANSMRARHAQYGGPREVPNNSGGLVGIDADSAAEYILSGIEADEFYLFTHHVDIAEVHSARSAEINAALERFAKR
jgi:NAD(P)-dependent dehydrogenase (short-subunit alcohol dehydrogenase family)